MTRRFEHLHGPGVVLCDSCPGRHRLMTASGAVYVLDFDERTLFRVPQDADAHIDLADPSAALRRDGLLVTLVELATPLRIGAGAVLVLSGVAEDLGVYTFRSTTPVVAVEVCPEGG